MGSWGKGAGKGHFIQYGPRWPRETLWASSPGEEFLGIVALQHKPGGVSGAWATLPLLFKWGGKAWPQSHTAEAAGEGSYVPGEGAPVQMTLCSACHGVGNPVVTIFQRPVQSQMLDTQVLRWLICDPGQASLAALRSEMPSHPSLTASVDPGCQEQAGVYFANKEAGWDHSQTCSRPPSLCRGQLKQTPWSTPLFSSFPHGMQGDRCSWTCHSRWLPSLPMKSALTLLTDGKFKTQDSSLATVLTCPSWNTRCFPTVLPSAPHPTVGENLSSAGCSGAQGQGKGGFACHPPPNLARPLPPASLAANRVASEPLRDLFWGLGRRLPRRSNANVFFTFLGMQREKFATNLSAETHISKTASEHTGLHAGNLQRFSASLAAEAEADFQKRARSPWQIPRTKTQCMLVPGASSLLWGFPRGPLQTRRKSECKIENLACVKGMQHC